MNRKGVSLPVNVLVVLAIAIVVLLGVLAFFSGSLNPTRESTSAMNKLNTCCTSYVMSGCPVQGQAPGEVSFSCPNSNKDLATLVQEANVAAGPNDVDGIHQACGCP